MADRLTAAGMRPINNVVDITNYVMLELGQPLHAFDYDKVVDHTIIVRRAAPGEQLTTLDDVTRTLTSEMLLITDPAGPNVIAGIFGGARVEVSGETTNVIAGGGALQSRQYPPHRAGAGAAHGIVGPLREESRHRPDRDGD